MFGKLRPSEGALIAGQAFGFYQLVTGAGFYLEGQPALGIGGSPGEGKAPCKALRIPVIKGKGYAFQGFLGGNVGLGNRNSGFSGCNAAAAPAASADRGAVVFAAAQEDGTAFKADAVAVSSDRKSVV